MQTLRIDELIDWCKSPPVGLMADPMGYLRFATGVAYSIRVDVPPEASKAVVLASTLLAIEEEESGFYGALIWFTNWDTGTPNIERCGLRMLEQMRRGYGVTASVENAPAQLFRTDEIADVHAFLALPLLFGWDAYFVPHGTHYFAYVRENASLFLVTDDERVLQRLQTRLEPYRPALELPSYLHGASADL